ncbi:MAG: 50S ribosomal protein L16 [Candidatus Rokuibacteriota bacterium]
MVRKPGKMYTPRKGRAYTRKEYMGGIPAPRIVRFDVGKNDPVFSLQLDLLTDETCQIRHTALDAARIAAVREMERAAGTAGFWLTVRLYPHHVLRENKVATGAGADRVSDGMRRAFGSLVGTAARVYQNHVVITIRTRPDLESAARNAMWRAGMKLPTPTHVEVKRVQNDKIGKAAAVSR